MLPKHTFVHLVAVLTDEQLEFPVLYASAKEGWASRQFTKGGMPDQNMGPLLDAIVQHVAAPKGDLHAPFQMLVYALFYLRQKAPIVFEVSVQKSQLN